MRPALRLLPLLALAAPPASADEPAALALPPLAVTATRSPQAANTLPLAVDVFSGETLRDTPAATVDDALRASAAFSLFRRSGSATANPTAQGASLRGIGPSGASRALVLLDGVPVNDPFGGWIAWSKLPTGALDRAEIVRGGGSSAWGGGSLGGVVQLFTAPPALSGRPRGSATASAGDFSTRGGEIVASASAPGGRDAFSVNAAAFATDGPRLVRDPGPIDTPADSRHARAAATWSRRLAETTTLAVNLRAWEEERGNGTPYQRNGSEELFASVALSGAPASGPAWTLLAYGQDQDFRSTFSSVNATRDAETPASDQYAVPASAAGLSAQATWGDAALDSGSTTLGLDARHVDGETREYFFFDGVNFARERRAGGAQTSAGLFATHARPLGDTVTATLGARVDGARRSDGFRRETIRASGAVSLENHYADRDDTAFSPSAGLAWRASDALTLRAAAYFAYRTPTLNELYRPFRVGPVTTLANPDLDPETLLGAELSAEWTRPDRRAGLRATVFENRLSDAVANVSLDAVTRQRRNLDSVRARGLELGGHWQAAPALRLDADYLLSDSRVRSGGPGAAALDGRRLAQVPRHTLTAGARWQAAPSLALDLRGRWVSRQYEDDLGALPLSSALRLDAAAHWQATPRLRLTLAMENALDAEIETGRTAAGVVSVAPPRLARIEASWAW